MKTDRMIIVLALVGSAALQSAFGTNVVITSFPGNGSLNWASDLSNASYEIQWASSLASSVWTNTWDMLVDIVPAGPTHSVTVPMFYRVVAKQPRTYDFPDYFPTDPNIYRKKIYQETNFLSSSSTISTNEIVAFKEAPYASGSIIGVADLVAWYFHNSGDTVRFLGTEGWFASTDTNLTAHPSCWSFGKVYDGMIVTQSYYAVKDDLSAFEGPDLQEILIDVQDVTLPTGTYSNSVIFWYLDIAKPFAVLDFHGKEAELGITLPAGSETEGYAVTEFEIYGRNAGLIAGGDIYALSGELDSLKRLQSVVSP